MQRTLTSPLKSLSVKYEKTFGIYYDNPNTTPAENCRSYIGIILENTDSDHQNLLKSAGFKLDSIPLKSSIVSQVDIGNSLSFMIGPFKVYPKFNEYLKEKNYRVSLSMEIYDVKAEKITLFMQYDNSVN